MHLQQKIAIIDLGSNSIRMIIMKIYDDGSYKMIDQAKEMVRLSEGMAGENSLKPLAVQRTLNTLKLFKKLVESHEADRVFTIATAAVRNAENKQLFLQKVVGETGFEFDVISGEQEAYYDYLGVINTTRLDNCVIIDTGGASTEIILVEGRRMKYAVSIPYGAVTLTEKFLEKDEISQESLKNIEDFMIGELKKIGWLQGGAGLPVVGLGGSVRTIAKIHKKKTGLAVEGLHNYHIAYTDIMLIYERITRSKLVERKDIPGLNKERADIISGGIVPMKILMDYLKSDKLVVSGNGLREGVFYKNYLEICEPGKEIVDDVLEHSLNNVLRNYDANIVHSYHVQKLALRMFDQMKEAHGLKEEYRELLSVGALLHDIGQYVDYYNHHKHGFYLMLNSRINGLTYRQVVMCAFIAAMHRNEEFKQDWKEFDLFIDKSDYEEIKKLGLFVRIAEELDRNEYGNVEDIQCHITKDSVQMLLKTKREADLEIAVAMQSDKAFEKLFGKKLYIV